MPDPQERGALNADPPGTHAMERFRALDAHLHEQRIERQLEDLMRLSYDRDHDRLRAELRRVLTNSSTTERQP